MENRKGFAPIVLIAVAVVLAIAAGVGYVVMNKGKAGGGIVPKVQLPGVPALNADCKLKDKELCRYIGQAARMEEIFQKGFSGTSVMTTKDGKKTESVWEMQGDKSHFQSTTGGKEDANVIIIGNTTYTKDMTDGKWFKYEAKSEGSSSVGGLFDTNQMKNTVEEAAKELEDENTYKALGKAPCGNLTCFKYEMLSAEMPGTKQYLYFDDREYLMRMLEMQDEIGSNVTMFKYDGVSINAPGPVKADDRMKGIDPSLLEKATGETSSIDMNELRESLQQMTQDSSSQGSTEGE